MLQDTVVMFFGDNGRPMPWGKQWINVEGLRVPLIVRGPAVREPGGVETRPVSMIDLAPYIYDALQPQLMLLSGTTGEDGPHDWIYLFEELGGLQHSQRYGRAVHTLGTLVGLLAWTWAALVVWLAWQQRNSQSDD